MHPLQQIPTEYHRLNGLTPPTLSAMRAERVHPTRYLTDTALDTVRIGRGWRA